MGNQEKPPAMTNPGQRLQGKVAIITGAGSGIGRAAALLFAGEGAKVVVADRNRDSGQDTVAEISGAKGVATFIPVDISQPRQVEALVQQTVSQFGGLNILLNNAAILIRSPSLVETSESDWDLTIDTDLKGAFLCCKFAIPAMVRSGGGSIVNVSSGAGLGGRGLSVPYGVAKAGIIQLTRAGAVEYGPVGIHMNCIVPGLVDTPQSRGSTGSTEAFQSRIENIPIGRVGQPEEIASLMLYLASDESSYINGACISADGGASTR